VAPGALVLSHLRREVEGNYRQGARDRTGLPVDVPRILRSRRVVGRTFLLFTCSLAAPILLFTALLFLLFPRVELSFMQLTRSQKTRMIGFDDHVDLGGVGELRANSTVALYADIPGLPEPPPDRIALHLRGTAFDTFDGKSWSRSNADWKPVDRPREPILLERPGDPARDRLLRFDLDPYDPPMLFLPQNAVAISVRARSEMANFSQPLRIERGPEGQLRYRATTERGIHYEVWVSQSPTPLRALPFEDRSRYLKLPPLPPRIAALAQSWTEGKSSPFDRAAAIERHLRTDYRYDLASPSGAAPAPLDHFLFESRRGHCEYYSSAMAVMLRQIGIPSRNVTGYVGGQYNRFSKNYVVRQRDAHSWVEAFLEGIGWVTFDPTPPAFSAPRNEQGVGPLLRDALDASNQRWDRYIVRYDIRRQLSLLERFENASNQASAGPGLPRPRHLLALAVGLLVLLGVFTLLRRRRPVRPRTRAATDSPVPAPGALLAVQLYEALENAMSLQGLGRPQGVPPLQHAQSSAVQKHPLGGEILELTRRYQELRFGGASLPEEQRRDIELRIKQLRAYRTAPRA
jgi:transglutaminase-like putative cysteine protease